MLMAGPQSRYTGFTAVSTIANRMRKNGVKVYSVGIGQAIIQQEVLGVGGKSDYITYASDYPGLTPQAATLAAAVQKRKYSRYRSIFLTYLCI